MPRNADPIRKAPHLRSPRGAAGEIILWVVRSALWIGFTSAGTALNMWAVVVLLLVLAPSNPWGYIALGFVAGVAGGLGGVAIGLGQTLALRRWLDGAASLGSFFSTVLASSAALASSSMAGWWMYTSAGDLAGVVSGVALYGCVFGLVQRPVLDYMSRRSHLWIPANIVAALLAAAAILAAFDVSGGRRDMLQFRYAGVAYSLVVGAAFLWMTREVRGAMAVERRARTLPAGERGEPAPGPGPALLEIHEHRVYKVYESSGDAHLDLGSDLRASHSHGRAAAGQADSDPEGGERGPDVIDASYRVIS